MWKWKLICWLIRKLTSSQAQLCIVSTDCVNWWSRNSTSLSDRWTTHNVRLKTPLPPVAIAATAAKVGVVIQGKVMTAEDFTVRTVEHYRNSFPGCPIYVSTWKDESSQVINALEKAGAVVLLNDPPKMPGPTHLNYQIRSTRAGVEAACRSGCEYVLKTRTDTRMYAANIPDFLAGLIAHFPVDAGLRVRGRLAVLDWATRLFIPQHPADMMMFGYAEDMATYWDVPLCESTEISHAQICTRFSELLSPLVPEVYLCRHYLNKLDYAFEPTLESWWQCLADLFVVVDRTSLEHFWPKYNYVSEHRNTSTITEETRPFAAFVSGWASCTPVSRPTSS